MPGIIEIWKKHAVPGAPVRFTVGLTPQQPNSDGVLVDVEDAPTVKSINFYLQGLGGKAYREPCYVIQFEDSDIRRVIPATAVGEIGWDSEASIIKALKEEQEAAGVPELED